MSLAVITGGSKGIGKAIGERFASEGFDLVLSARNMEQLEKTKSEIEEKYKITCYVLSVDLASKSGCKTLIEYVKLLKVPVDVLVNNAGVFAMGPLMDEENEDLERLIETNLYSAYWITKGLFSSMKESKNAHLFNICSIASLAAYPNSGAYTVSKFAMLGLSKSLRVELIPSNIKVTSVMPGATFTDSWSGTELPESRFMKASDVAEATWSAYQLSPSTVVEEIILRPMEGDI